ncbi:pseudoazurin [Paracoccus sediminicola]|uniref:pseudoazurin n=1 Tax=Paracoccus sediminicola TaxID=3017783 RepID=UPI0022F02482|nr:pseudoazurin [Paracoccus sediminicola]WBU58747.1 pseudoazurin [Paracoccus sediminicola]
MFRTTIIGFALAALVATGAIAETHEVQMLNRGENGDVMVFEPAFLQVAPGDTVRFVATDRGHNAEAILEMTPEGADAFKGRINEEIEITLDTEGLYGIKCAPHYAMGMVMTIAVGEVTEVPDEYLAGRIPPNAMERFVAQIEELGL